VQIFLQCFTGILSFHSFDILGKTLNNVRFGDEETEAQRLNNMCKTTLVAKGGTRVLRQAL
jgi:hypothetical protein